MGLDSALPLSAASTIVDTELEAAAWGALGMGSRAGRSAIACTTARRS